MFITCRALREGIAAGAVVLAALVALSGAASAKELRETVLHSFRNSHGDGAYPRAEPIADGAGNLYGTTSSGGKYDGGNDGIVFRLAPDGTETVLHSFCAKPPLCPDGAGPDAGLILDGAGNLYGTTRAGGKHGWGTVFRMTPDGRETILYSFCAKTDCKDGGGPEAGLIADGAGNLYGTTYDGGEYSLDAGGTVFRLAPDGTETVLHSFCSYNCVDGFRPYAKLVMDGAGNLYGTTLAGGQNNAGTVFKVTPNGAETVLHSFCSKAHCADGSNPYAGLIFDGGGNLYGTTWGGGARGEGGVIFKVAPDGTETVLHNFCSKNCPDGGVAPYAGLIADAAGNLYGTAGGGKYGVNGGVVFKLAPDGTETVLYSFCPPPYDCRDGRIPYTAGLIADGAGNLYGTTQGGGKDDAGVVFKLSASP